MMQESTAQELIAAIERLTFALDRNRELLYANSESNGDLKEGVLRLSDQVLSLGSDISSLSRDIDANTSAAKDLTSDMNRAARGY